MLLPSYQSNTEKTTIPIAQSSITGLGSPMKGTLFGSLLRFNRSEQLIERGIHGKSFLGRRTCGRRCLLGKGTAQRKVLEISLACPVGKF